MSSEHYLHRPHELFAPDTGLGGATGDSAGSENPQHNPQHEDPFCELNQSSLASGEGAPSYTESEPATNSNEIDLFREHCTRMMRAVYPDEDEESLMVLVDTALNDTHWRSLLAKIVEIEPVLKDQIPNFRWPWETTSENEMDNQD